jgi:integrase
MTTTGHRECGNRYILPYLGERALEELRPHHLDEWLAKLQARGLGAWTLNGAFRRLRACLNVAIKRGMIARNVCKQVDAPPKGPRRTRVLNIEQQAALLAELEHHRLYAAFAVAGTLGLRPSELLGLRVGALQLDGDTPALIVREQLQYLIGDDGKHGAHRERSTKGGSEQNPNARVIPLSLELAAILRAHLTTMKAERLVRGQRPLELDADDLLFVTEAGAPMGDRNMLGYLHRACTRAGVPRVSLHALRHTAGSVMLARGEQIVDVAAVLGHKNPNITAEIYAHSFDQGKRSAVNAASAALLRRA